MIKAEWKTIRFKMYYIESGVRRCGTPIVKDVTGHGITRWKTQRKGKYLAKISKN